MLAPLSLNIINTLSSDVYHSSNSAMKVEARRSSIYKTSIAVTLKTISFFSQLIFVKWAVRLINDCLVPDQQSVVKLMELPT